jgi:hypothetical protein
MPANISRFYSTFSSSISKSSKQNSGFIKITCKPRYVREHEIFAIFAIRLYSRKFHAANIINFLLSYVCLQVLKFKTRKYHVAKMSYKRNSRKFHEHKQQYNDLSRPFVIILVVFSAACVFLNM